jgi:hypothetical protein
MTVWRRRSLAFSAAFSVLAAAVSAGPAALPSPVFPKPFGVNIHFTDGRPGEIAKLGRAYRVARMDLAWASTERAKGVYDFAAYDRLVRDLEGQGVTPLFILDYGNDLYQQGPPRNQAARAAYARWAAAAVHHFRDHRIIWEIWNEPNVVHFWGGRPDPNEYARLAREAIAAIRKRVPDATIAVGAYGGFPWDFIETTFKGGILKGADAVTVHPYRGGAPESVAADYARLRFLISKYSPKNQLPILSGEWGYSTVRKTGVSETTQAAYLVRQRLINASQGVNLSIWYDWKDDGPDPDENEHRFGSLRQDLKSKPAYVAAEVMTRTLDGYSPVRMLREGPGGYVMLLQNAREEFALALWSTSDDEAFRVPGPRSRIVDMLGGEEAAPHAGERIVYFGTSPRYVLLGRNDTMALRAAWEWLTPGALVTAGEATKTRFSIRNPLDRPCEFDIRLSVEGGVVSRPTVKARLAPGESLSIAVDVTPVLRQREAAAVARVVSSASGLSVTDEVRIPLTVRNPLDVSARISRDEAAEFVVVREAGGPGETVSVALTDARGKTLAARMVSLSGRETAFSMPLPRGRAGEPFGLRISDGHGRRIGGHATVSFQPFATFAGARAGKAVPGLAIHREGDSNTGARATLTLDSSSRGPVATARLEYSKGWCYFVVTPSVKTIPSGTVAVGMWVNGDGSGDYLRCRFVDAKGQTFQPTYGAVNWKGWKWVTMRLDDPSVGSWGGPQDGVIHPPIKWDAVFLLDSASQTAHKSVVQFQGLTHIVQAK